MNIDKEKSQLHEHLLAFALAADALERTFTGSVVYLTQSDARVAITAATKVLAVVSSSIGS